MIRCFARSPSGKRPSSWCSAWPGSYLSPATSSPGGWQTALVIVGFTHGCVFTVYLFLVLLVRARMRWRLFTTLSILVAGLIPGGGYVVEAWALSGARVAALADVL